MTGHVTMKMQYGYAWGRSMGRAKQYYAPMGVEHHRGVWQPLEGMYEHLFRPHLTSPHMLGDLRQLT